MKFYKLRYRQDDPHHTPSHTQGELWVPAEMVAPDPKDHALRAFFELVDSHADAWIVDETPDDPMKDIWAAIGDLQVSVDAAVRKIRSAVERGGD